MHIADRVKMTTATTGTGTITLDSASTGYRSFASAGIPDGDVVSYCIEDGNAWEVGRGVYTSSGTTLTRTLVASSTGSLLSLSGSATVFLTPLASDLDPLLLDTEYTGTTNPSAPAEGLRIFCRKRGNRRRPAWLGAVGLETQMQSFLGGQKIAYWSANGNSNTAFNSATPGVMVFNWGNATSGTATSRNVANTNRFTLFRRLGYVTATTANALGGNRHNSLQFIRGQSTADGGFEYVVRAGISAYTAGMHAFIGMNGSAATFTGTPSADTGVKIGFGFESGDTNWQLYLRGTTNSKTNLGANFPCTTANADMYEFRLFSPPGASSNLGWEIVNLSTGNATSGTVTGSSTDLPGTSTLLAPHVQICNAATSAAVGIDIVTIYLETDY